jgi:multimeric flavodoxin WrbA
MEVPQQLVSILGIIGSPRRKGNTETLVDEVLAGAKEAGATTIKFILDEMDIRPCRACNACVKKKECVQKDDFHSLVEKMQKSDVWILGTPVYWWGPTAQFKAFIDRWYSVSRTTFSGKRIILTIPFGGGATSYARHTVGILEDIIPYLNMTHIATILAPGSHRHGAVRSDDKAMAAARNAGEIAIRDLK